MSGYTDASFTYSVLIKNALNKFLINNGNGLSIVYCDGVEVIVTEVVSSTSSPFLDLKNL